MKGSELYGKQIIYILTEEYKIGVVKYICTCEQCIKRGQVEVFIDDLEGGYLDCIKLSKLNKDIISEEILTCGSSVQEIFDYMKNKIDNYNKKCEFLSEVNKLLNKKICDKNN